MFAWRQQHLRPTGLLKHQKAHLYFSPNRLKDGTLFYSARITTRPNLPLTHTQEAMRLAVQTELPAVQSQVVAETRLSLMTAKNVFKNNDMKRRSVDFFIKSELKQDLSICGSNYIFAPKT